VYVPIVSLKTQEPEGFGLKKIVLTHWELPLFHTAFPNLFPSFFLRRTSRLKFYADLNDLTATRLSTLYIIKIIVLDHHLDTIYVVTSPQGISMSPCEHPHFSTRVLISFTHVILSLVVIDLYRRIISYYLRC